MIAVYPGLEPSGLPATLTPAQAAVAARLLHDRALCPIHYGTFNNPPVYVEHDDPLGTLAEAAAHESVDMWALQEGEWIYSNAMDNTTKHSFSDSEDARGQE